MISHIVQEIAGDWVLINILIDRVCTVYILGHDINGSTVIGIIQRDLKWAMKGLGQWSHGVWCGGI